MPDSTTVRSAVMKLLRHHGLTTVFGNPGSTELPFLADFPTDFRYVLGLQEAVVTGMADGYAQITGRPALVNLHTAAGVGNAMGAIVNAAANRSPLVITAGQQVRSMVTLEALLTNVDATTLPRPAVKWSFEPPRPADVPAALARAVHLADAAPRGPVFVSIPMDDFDAELTAAEAAQAEAVTRRTVNARPVADGHALADVAARIDAAANPAFVFGAEVDADAALSDAMALAERVKAPVWTAPVEGRIAFPHNHKLFAGFLPPGIALVSRALAGHDLIVVIGAPVFRYYPYVPGPWLPKDAKLIHITSDPDEAARAPMGDAIVGRAGQVLPTLTALVSDANRPSPPSRLVPTPEAVKAGQPLPPDAVLARLAHVAPADAIWVHESPSNTQAFQEQVRLSAPCSYLTAAGGGLGFGLSAAVGAGLAAPNRRVIALMGDGSCQYAITALWTAARYGVAVTFVVLTNSEYAILKWFAGFEKVTGAPGLDVPGIDMCALATGYGVPAYRADDLDKAGELFAAALSSEGPSLIEIPIKTVLPTV